MARILVVDDEADIRLVVESLFVARGHSVATVPDGPRALKALAAEHFDVVVLDVMMPGTSGIEVLDTVRADRRLHGLPVLVLSADADAAGRAHGLRHGADDFVAKPFDMEELTLRVERLATHARDQFPLSGDLDFLGAEGLLEVLAQTRSATRISTPVGDALGEIVLVAGRVAAASFGALSGSDAVLALIETAHGRFSIVPEEPGWPVAEDAPLVHSLLFERAWLEDEIHKRSDAVPAAAGTLEAVEGPVPAGREANEVPWSTVLEAIRARPGIAAGELFALLPIAPVRLRLALALLVEAGSVRMRTARPTSEARGGGRLAELLSDLLLEVLFRGQDVDRLKVEVLADESGCARAEGWFAQIPDELRDGPIEIDSERQRITTRLQHPTGRAEIVLRRVGLREGEPVALSGDALFCVLLMLDYGTPARQREQRLLAELALARAPATAMVWISPRAADPPPAPPWHRMALPVTLEDLFAQLLGAKSTV
jgi:CheY-like chemotaxis protein